MMEASEVLDALRKGRSGGADVVRFSGGEPFMDRRLPSFIRAAKQVGFTGVEVETNGTLLSQAGASSQIVKWGVTRVWLALMHEEESHNDALSRATGTAELTWKALENLGEGLNVGLNVAVTSRNALGLDRLVDKVMLTNPNVDRIRFNMVTEAFEEPVREKIEGGLKKACGRARKYKLEFRVESSFAPPPCVFSEEFLRGQLPLYGSYRGQVGSVDGERVRHGGCEQCGFKERCPGIQPHLVDRELPLQGLSDSLLREVKGHLGGEGRSQKTQSSSVELLERNPGETQKLNLRVNWACNQRCRFCWVDFDWAPPSMETLLGQIEEASTTYSWIVFTGGEPTLVSWLPKAIERARDCGYAMIQIQSNGVHLSNDKLRKSLVDNGLTHALISLHGASSIVSDEITQAPGTFERSLQGIDGLVKDGVTVSLSHVLTEKNIHETREFAQLVWDRWQGAVEIVWSVAAPITEATDRYEDGLLSLDRVSAPLLKGLETCLELGVGFGGQNDTCGVPPCVLNDDPRFVAEIQDEHRSAERDFYFPEPCGDCSLRSRCRGVRRGYVERFGSLGLVPR